MTPSIKDAIRLAEEMPMNRIVGLLKAKIKIYEANENHEDGVIIAALMVLIKKEIIGTGSADELIKQLKMTEKARKFFDVNKN